MIELYLMRHGIAVEIEEPGVASDAERELSAAGRIRLQQEAVGIRELGLKPDLILSSPLRRCRQTADIVASRLGMQDRTQILGALAPGRAFLDGVDSRADIFIELGAWQFERALLVGHQPDLAEIASYLLAGTRHLNLDFRKGSICAIEIASIPPRGPGLLRWMMAPRQLRMLARCR